MPALLCNTCNQGLGYFGDDLERLARAVGYLKESKMRRVRRRGREGVPS